jgi:hypothetical protein
MLFIMPPQLVGEGDRRPALTRPCPKWPVVVGLLTFFSLKEKGRPEDRPDKSYFVPSNSGASSRSLAKSQLARLFRKVSMNFGRRI